MNQTPGYWNRSKKKWSLNASVFLLFIFGLVTVYNAVPDTSAFESGQIKQTRWLRTKSQTEVMVGPDSANWSSIDATSKHLINAIISAEDTRFFEHNGVDFREIWRSLKLNLDKGRIVRGASTITQQVVKLGLLSSEKSFVRKAREAVGALLLERKLSKIEILGWYINLADFGSGVYGIRAASKYYFQTTPDKLTVAESIHLALVLPAPNTWSESLKQKSLTEFGRRRFANVLDELLNSGYITKNEYEITSQTGNFGRPITSVVVP